MYLVSEVSFLNRKNCEVESSFIDMDQERNVEFRTSIISTPCMFRNRSVKRRSL